MLSSCPELVSLLAASNTIPRIPSASLETVDRGAQLDPEESSYSTAITFRVSEGYTYQVKIFFLVDTTKAKFCCVPKL
jgi:hypothetical protein